MSAFLARNGLRYLWIFEVTAGFVSLVAFFLLFWSFTFPVLIGFVAGCVALFAAVWLRALLEDGDA